MRRSRSWRLDLQPIRLLVVSFVSTVFIIGGSPARAEDLTAVPRPVLRAVKIEVHPTIDGDVLTDPTWAALPAAGGFRQSTPDTGAPSSERTEVRVAYTADTLYIAAVCFDRGPSSAHTTVALTKPGGFRRAVSNAVSMSSSR